MTNTPPFHPGDHLQVLRTDKPNPVLMLCAVVAVDRVEFPEDTPWRISCQPLGGSRPLAVYVDGHGRHPQGHVARTVLAIAGDRGQNPAVRFAAEIIDQVATLGVRGGLVHSTTHLPDGSTGAEAWWDWPAGGVRHRLSVAVDGGVHFYVTGASDTRAQGGMSYQLHTAAERAVVQIATNHAEKAEWIEQNR